MTYKLFALSICILSFITGCKKEESSSDNLSKPLIVGTSADNPPFEYLKEGKIVGFDIAIVEEIGKILKREIKIQDMNFDGVLGSLTSGRIDMAIAGLSATPERRKNVDFSDPYYTTGISIVFMTKDSYHSVSDLAGKNIGAQAGSAHDFYAREKLVTSVPNLTLKNLPRIPELIQDLKVGRISAIIIGTKEAQIIAKENSDMSLVEIGSDPGFSIALPKGSALTQKVNEALVEMEEKGTMTTLKNQWF